MNFLVIAQTLLGMVLVAAILFQNRGAGLGSAWGGGGELYVTRRGVEKFLFRITVLIAIVFVLVSLTSLVA